MSTSMDPLKFLDDFVITPSQQTAVAASGGLGNILNYFTLWVVAFASILTVYVLIPLVPKAPANLIIMICSVALIVGIWLHVNQFGSEYRLSTWQNNLQFYGSIVLLTLVVFLAMGLFYYNTDPGIRDATDSMLTRAQATVTSSTRSFTNLVSSRAPSTSLLGTTNTNTLL
jgi:hypothetical protein